MASELTPAGKLVKWILIPVALGCLGYFIIGPRLSVKIGDVKSSSGSHAKSAATSESQPKPEESLASNSRTMSHPSPLIMGSNRTAPRSNSDDGPEVTITEGTRPDEKGQVVYQASPRRRTSERKPARRHKNPDKTQVKVVEEPKDSGSVGGLEGTGTAPSSHAGSTGSDGGTKGTDSGSQPG